MLTFPDDVVAQIASKDLYSIVLADISEKSLTDYRLNDLEALRINNDNIISELQDNRIIREIIRAIIGRNIGAKLSAGNSMSAHNGIHYSCFSSDRFNQTMGLLKGYGLIMNDPNQCLAVPRRAFLGEYYPVENINRIAFRKNELLRQALTDMLNPFNLEKSLYDNQRCK